MSFRLFTIGYEGWEPGAFVDYLAARGVACVIDVRENPFSRKPGFSKGSLSRALEAAGIQYIHLKALGTPRPLRDAVKSDGDYGRFFCDMDAYLATQSEAVSHASAQVRGMTCCLLCYERSVDTCHRKIVAAKIAEVVGQPLVVTHL